jgi:hypothetical protein
MKSNGINNEESTPFYNFIIVRLKDSKPSIVGYSEDYDDAMTILIENKMQYHDDQFAIYDLNKRKVNNKMRWLIDD